MTKKTTSNATTQKFTYAELKALKDANLADMPEKEFDAIVARLAMTQNLMESGTIKGLEKTNLTKLAPEVSELVLEELELRTPKANTQKQAPPKADTQKQAPPKANTQKQAPPKADTQKQAPPKADTQIDLEQLEGKEVKMLINNWDGYETRQITVTYADNEAQEIEVRYFEERGKKTVKIQDTFVCKAVSPKLIAVRNDSYFMGLLELKETLK